jgi:hypothetical protein
MQTNNSVFMGTAGGTFLSIVPNILSVDIFRTVVLASVGAVVSFTLSFVLKCILKKFRK